MKLTVAEIIEARKQAESDIAKLVEPVLNRFAARTGLVPGYISVGTKSHEFHGVGIPDSANLVLVDGVDVSLPDVLHTK